MDRNDIERARQELISRGGNPGKIELIAALRERHKVDLRTAKVAVDRFFEGKEIPESMIASDLEPILSDAYSEFTQSGDTSVLAMIKRVRERTGLGLKEARELVEAYVRKRNPELANRRSGLLGVLDSLFRR